MKAKNLILGVDIGASKIHIVVWNGKKVLKCCRVKEATPKKLKEAISAFGIKQVGVGVPGIVDLKSCRILKCPNLPCFNGVNLKRILGGDVRCDNDAKCFLRAEAMLGAARGYENVLGITFGTGIGGGVIINEKLKIKNEKLDKEIIYMGKHGSAGEFGHMVIDQGKTWEELYQENKDNPKKQELLNAQGIANLVNIFDPEIIVLGGGAAKIPSEVLIEKYLVSPLAKKTKIVLSKLGEDAGAIGAALLH